MGQQIEITEALDRCCEAARSLWNNFLRQSKSRGQQDLQNVDWDRVSAFDELRTLIFREIVLVPIGQQTFCRPTSQAPFDFIQLVPTTPSIPIMINRVPDTWSGYWDDPIARIDRVGTEILFVDYFDWDVTSFRDFRYYLVRIVKFENHAHLSGRYALIETQHVRAYFDPPPLADALGLGLAADTPTRSPAR